ncbi:MAG TPA: pilin [Rhodanobacter sp.]|nr:pilin [Rhodanobacter sp.]
MLWALFLLFPFGIAILAAIAIPAYQDFLVRSQVAEGMVLADGAKTAMTVYYEGHHALPTDNASAGLAQSSSISGRYVSSVDVTGGVVTVAFDTTNSNRSIRYQTLVFLPVVSNDKISWNCSNASTVPARDLPISCRK